MPSELVAFLDFNMICTSERSRRQKCTILNKHNLIWTPKITLMTSSSKKLNFPSFIECWFFILHLWSAFIACGLVGRGDPLIRQFLVHDGFSYQSCPTHLLLALTRPTTFFVIVMSFLFFQQAVVFETLS